jgi:hypothetical protein
MPIRANSLKFLLGGRSFSSDLKLALSSGVLTPEDTPVFSYPNGLIPVDKMLLTFIRGAAH